MKYRQFLLPTALALLAQAALAQTTVKDPWVRSTVAEQKATGAFMQITSASGGRLVSASSPAAGVVEIHEMAMDGNTMRMRAVPALDLPAGKAVELKPGGYHVMLMDLKAPLAKDSTVPLTLVFKDAKGVESKVELKVPVAAVAPGAPAAKAGDMPAMDHGKHKP